MNVLLLLILLIPSSHAPETRVDVIELNHVLCNGKESFVQYIFWDLEPVNQVHDYHVVAWRHYVKVGVKPRVIENDGYVLEWSDANGSYRVIGTMFHETASNYDPELKDREEIAENYRRGLAGDKSRSGPRPSRWVLAYDVAGSPEVGQGDVSN